MLSFQSLLEENEIWIACNATCFKQKFNHNKKQWKLKTFLILKAATRDVFFTKRCSQKICKLHTKTPMLESLFDKAADFFSPTTLSKIPLEILNFLSKFTHWVWFWMNFRRDSLCYIYFDVIICQLKKSST